jgi:hypothetical protein
MTAAGRQPIYGFLTLAAHLGMASLGGMLFTLTDGALVNMIGYEPPVKQAEDDNEREKGSDFGDRHRQRSAWDP